MANSPLTKHLMLSEKKIQEFKDLYKLHYGIQLSNEEAIEFGENLISLFEDVYKPITKKEYEKYKK